MSFFRFKTVFTILSAQIFLLTSVDLFGLGLESFIQNPKSSSIVTHVLNKHEIRENYKEIIWKDMFVFFC